MAYTGIWQDNLPWSDTENDRKVVGYIFISLFISTVLYIIIQFLPVQQFKEQKLEVVAPRLAKLIIEHEKKLRPPPPLPQTHKKAIPKPTPRKAVKPKFKPKPMTERPHARKFRRPRPSRAAVARRQAQQHITEIQDALAGLRDMNVASTIEHNQPIHNRAGRNGHARNNTDNTTAVIAAQAGQGSGGINTSHLSRATGSTGLQGRRTTTVTSNLFSGSGQGGTGTGGNSNAHSRSYEEVSLVFDKNKNSIYSLYARALRRDPTLQGKVVIELTISPAGRVTRVRIISSQIKDARLLEQLKLRIKLFRFQPKNVQTLIVKYPIDFLPT